MIHEKYKVVGTITVDFPAEDWVWWCKFLRNLLNEPDQDEWDKEDLDCIIRTLENAVEGGKR
jgi:hypothetical protein